MSSQVGEFGIKAVNENSSYGANKGWEVVGCGFQHVAIQIFQSAPPEPFIGVTYLHYTPSSKAVNDFLTDKEEQ